jgi:uncharacterized protein (DUF433 family)/DNA-binding transcriptional MerR regulator
MVHAVAYEPKVAGALSGVTQRQLGYWRTEGILVPEVSANRPVLYSFRDVVALRTFAYLRGSRSLQAIRTALKNLKLIGETDHLSSYKLHLQGKRSIVLIKNDQAVDLVERPGQTLTVVRFGDLIRSFPLGDLEVPNLFRPRRLISVDPQVRGGHPVVKDTRVPFELIAGLVRDGVSPGDVAEFYPSVSENAARDAVDFADYVDRTARRQAA